MADKNFDSTILRMAGNILAGCENYLTRDDVNRKMLRERAVIEAEEIVAFQQQRAKDKSKT